MVATPTQVARLQAGAKGGTAGVQAYDDAQAQVRQGRDQAINSLKGEAAQLGAPGAFTTQLSTQIAQPAATALANLASQGGVERAAAQSNQGASDTYNSEATAGLANIRAQSDADERQREALLAASRSRSGGGGGGGGGGSGGLASLSDSALKNELLGAAQAFRKSNQLYNSAKVSLAAAQAERPVGHVAIPGGQGVEAGIGGRFIIPIAQADPTLDLSSAAAAQQFSSAAGARQLALADLQRQLYAPGITQEAQQIGLQSGVDPARVFGILSPSVEAQYDNANQSLFKQQQGPPPDVTGQILDPVTAGSQLISGEHLTPAQVHASLNQQYIDWNSGTLKNALAQWVAAQPAGTITPGESPADIQAAFAKDPANARFVQPKAVVRDIVNNLTDAAKNSYSYQAALATLQTDPAFLQYPREYALAATMAKPIFDYYAALRTRQTAAPPPGSNYDPTALAAAG